MLHQQHMVGHLALDGRVLARGGFLYPALGPQGLQVGPSVPLIERIGRPQAIESLAELEAELPKLQRGEFVGDLQQLMFKLGTSLKDFQRGIERGVTSSMTAFPVRENLEAEAKILVPLDTPFRAMLPRTPGAGTASAWRQLTALGGGWGSAYDQPGGGSATRMFFAETGAPAEHTSVYAAKSASYKLLGTYFSVTGFAMASGANFQQQYATERKNAILNLMLNEEHALINGDSAATAAPWGDGSSALAFDGIINLVTVANGTPSAQVQTSVGALTIAHLEAQLTRIWKQGGRDMYILCNAQETQSLSTLAQSSSTIIRVQATATEGQSVLGLKVTGIVHPVSGEIVPIHTSRFVPAGTIIFGSKYLPDGSPSADVNVLPQVELPQLAPNEPVQGYTAQELAATTAAPQVFAGIVTVYEVLRLKGATVFAKSTGVTAA